MPVGTAFFDTFLATLQEWTDDLDLSTDMLISWIYMAEERFNNELRVAGDDRHEEGVIGTINACRRPATSSKMVSVRYSDSGLPLRYVSLRRVLAYALGVRVLPLRPADHGDHLSRSCDWRAARAVATATGFHRLPRSVRTDTAARPERLHDTSVRCMHVHPTVVPLGTPGRQRRPRSSCPTTPWCRRWPRQRSRRRSSCGHRSSTLSPRCHRARRTSSRISAR